jgi:hypothetical protein
VQKYPYKGENLTVAELAKRVGLSGCSVRNRLAKGVSLDDPKHGSKTYPYFGEGKTIKAILKIEGVTREAIRQRIAKGSTELGVIPRKRRRVLYKGAMRTTHEIVDLDGITYGMAAKLVRDLRKG